MPRLQPWLRRRHVDGMPTSIGVCACYTAEDTRSECTHQLPTHTIVAMTT
jgi:hypothetical protein